MAAPDNEPLTLERTFQASKEDLYNAWVDPEVYKRWLNPAGIDLVIHEWDAREGGKVAFDMPQPDGNPHPQTGMFHELDPYDRIVTGEPDKSFLIEVDFIAQNGDTLMRVKITGLPPEFREPAKEGWAVCFDQIAKLVEA